MTETPQDPAPTPHPDGRKQRSERSRLAIVDAMLDIIMGGKMEPSAAEIAERAGVSARTVFRHFEEMDSLYSEMTERMEAQIMPIIQQPFTGDGWQAQLDQLLERRATIYEKIMPLKIAASIRRFSSQYLMLNYQRFLHLERTGLENVLPEPVRRNATQFSAIEMCAGFQTWRRLRQDQNLSIEQAADVVKLTITKLLD
ncbi:TetR/AcrR family transcriptional regulator [Blastomonas sp.]|uniref:TetR/AcrR family transcriptional regulator n=1 Tax=Blastomonas sp. TaxID=1909299 RepID=UPI0026293B15|nr:TetR/AcrR family transcriptional regulator [Blastomonas sp.]MDM7956218.1 TetR/AcrR family transcriptional regulator [Blastomonas sp.]